MKKLILSATLALTVSAPVMAEEKQSKFDTCVTFSDLAEAIMTSRQRGAEMAKLYKIANGNSVTEEMINNAFNVSKYSTEKYRKDAVSKFKNKYFKLCINSK